MELDAVRDDACMRWTSHLPPRHGTSGLGSARRRAGVFRSCLPAWVAASCVLWSNHAAHASNLEDEIRAYAQSQWREPVDAAGSRGLPALRYVVDVGAIDARLRLAPCERIEPQWPAGVRPWGLVRVALRCVKGPTPWKVYVPVRVKALARMPVLNAPVAAGATIGAQHLGEAEVDVAATPTLPVSDSALLIGRVLTRPLPAGAAVQPGDLQRRQWFAMGDTVRVDAVGEGFRVAGEGEAVTPGIEGQPSRVRLASGRVVTGRAVGERMLEVAP